MPTCGVKNMEGKGYFVTLLTRLPEGQSVQDLVQDIRGINLLSIGLITETFLGGLTAEELDDVFQALLACPTMDILRLSDLKDRSFRACCRALVVGHANNLKNLKELKVTGLTLVEDDQSSLMTSFVESMSKIPRLEKLHLLLIAPDEGSNVESSVTAEFRGSGFGNERTLWSLGLYDQYTCLIRDVVRCNQDRFSNLKISGTDTSGAALKALGVLLLTESNESSALDKVQLSLDTTHPDGTRQLANALTRNRRLKELSLLIGEPHASTSFSIEPLADMLRTNSTLEWLEVSRGVLNDTSALTIAEALKDNQTLKVLDVNFDAPGRVRMTDKGFEQWMEALYVNHTLEIVPTHGLENDSLRRRIEWYLNLNDSGLRQVQLSVNTTQDEFLNILQAQEDLDYVFYLLSQNTSLFRNVVV